MKHYLLDASAFIMLIKIASVQTTMASLQDSSVLNLTFYEVGNAIWKESTLTKFLTPNEAKALEKVAQTIFGSMDQIAGEAKSFPGILEIAKNEKLSFYDSSYIYFAKERELKLVTEDKKLNMIAQKYVCVQTTTKLIFP